MSDKPFGRGAPLPPPRPERLYPVWWARADHPALELLCLAEDWEAYWLHWCPADEQYPKGRSRLCLFDVEDCPWHVFSRHWSGYLPVWNYGERKAGGLVIPPTLGQDLAKIGSGYGGLLGKRITVAHTGYGKGAGVRGRVSDAAPTAGNPVPIDLQPTLQRMWGLSRTPNAILMPQGRRELIPFPEPEETDRYGLGGAKGGVR